MTRDSVSGTALPLSQVGDPVQLFLHGTVGEADKHHDFWFGGPGPYFDGNRPQGPIPQFQTGGWYGNPDFAGNFLLAYWRSPFEGTIQGNVVVDVWVSSATQSLGGQLTFTLFDVPEGGIGEGFPVIARATVSAAGVGPAPTAVQAVLENVAYTVPTGREVVLSVSGTFIDADFFQVWYDSTDFPSSFTVPVLASGPSGAPPRPAGLQGTSLVKAGVRLSWDRVADATSYAVHRSGDPSTLGPRIALVPPSGNPREYYTDTSLKAGSGTFYRVVSLSSGGNSEPSDAVHGTPVFDRLWVEVRAGRGPWETATGTSSWRIVLARALGPGADPRTFTARAHTWAGVSTEVVRIV